MCAGDKHKAPTRTHPCNSGRSALRKSPATQKSRAAPERMRQAPPTETQTDMNSSDQGAINGSRGAPAVRVAVSGVMMRRPHRGVAMHCAAHGPSGSTSIATGDPAIPAPPFGAAMSSVHAPASRLLKLSVSVLLFGGRAHHTRSFPDATSVSGTTGTLHVGLPKMSQQEIVREPVRPATIEASWRSILHLEMSIGPATQVSVMLSVVGLADLALVVEGSSFTVRE